MREMTAARISQARFIGLILLLILALGAVFRVVNLASDSIWLDEAYSIQFAHLPSASQVISETATSDVHPPLYYLLLHYWVGLFGDTEFSVRLLSAICGLLAILALYMVAALLFDRTTALLGALLLALSQFHIGFSQEARMYSLLALLALLSSYFFLKLLARNSLVVLLAYVVCTSLLTYTHVYSFFIIIAQNLFLFSLYFFNRELFKRTLVLWLVAQVAVALLFLPWLFVLIRQFTRVRQGFWIPRPPLAFIGQTLLEYAGSWRLAALLFPLMLLPIVLLWQRVWNAQLVRAIFQSTEDEHSRSPLTYPQKISFLLLWFASSIIIPFVVSHLSSPIYLPKYTIAASLPFLLLAARGLMSFRSRVVHVLLLLLIMSLTWINLRGYWSVLHKDDWRDAVAFFDQTARPGDLVLFTEPPAQVPFDYYSKHAGIVKAPFPLSVSEKVKTDQLNEKVATAIEGHNRFWLVISHASAQIPLITRALGESYKTTEHRIDPGVELYLFEKGATAREPPAPEDEEGKKVKGKSDVDGR